MIAESATVVTWQDVLYYRSITQQKWDINHYTKVKVEGYLNAGDDQLPVQ